MNKKLHIAMDLDGTLVDWINPPEKIAAEKLGVRKPEKFDYFYKGCSIKLRAGIFSLFKDFEFMSMDNLTYDVFDKLALAKWKDNGHILTIITCRNKNLKIKKETERIINEWFPEIDNLIITKHGKDKIAHFRKIKPDFWIDDHPDIAHEAQRLGIKTYLIDKPYNKDSFWEELQRIQSIYQLWLRGMVE